MNDDHTTALLSALEQRAEYGLAALREAHTTIAELERRLAELEADNQRLQQEVAAREPAASPRSQGLAALMSRRPRFAARHHDPATPAPAQQSQPQATPRSPQPKAATAPEPVAPVTETTPVAERQDEPQSRLPIGEAPSPQALLDEWYQRYPQTFFKGHTRPLKVGIHEDLVAREPWPDKLVRRALACYVHLPRYLKAVRTGAERVDLDGANAGDVSDGEARYARRQLDELRAQNRTRKAQKAERQAQREKETRLEQKLGQLLAKHEQR
ncbi:ProQ/FINO family protein [Franzmannia qiaohouensis]|uniref:ProQ/FINO family protein n=1 Tax=Franzmannia qiaohouensis TaxID=1329370 RepID=A0ABU1HAG9_9GAMM|nr:ProQ/FINO family protein [Halomonas qiaohouensis]MDR5904302.1 ProQ/FINO family protein [Halomonas qiaohouensis]